MIQKPLSKTGYKAYRCSTQFILSMCQENRMLSLDRLVARFMFQNIATQLPSLCCFVHCLKEENKEVLLKHGSV